jgi:predicted site-specific integrase-resolvase
MSKPLNNERYLPLMVAAKKYYYTPRTLRRWVKKGNICGVQQANKWWIGENSLKQYLKSLLDHD